VRAATAVVAAVDLGASSGRVMRCEVSADAVHMTETHRFPNRPVTAGGTLYWDVLALHAGVLDGLRAAAGTGGRLDSVGIDSWAVDHGLLDRTGALLGNPVHYRDARTDGVMERVAAEIGEAELYRTTGLAQLPFNTLYQLVSARDTPVLAAAATLLLIPDLLAYWLTGRVGAEVTNASTTQLLDVSTGTWATALAERAGVPVGVLPPLRRPGDVIGPVTAAVAAEAGLSPGLPVLAVGSHDTASAVVAVPARGERFAYVSCGTWSLVGVELGQPVLTEAARLANFTNEGGVDGTVRFLRNVMGLWLLQECRREWALHGDRTPLAVLLAAAEAETPRRSLVDVDDPRFLPPGSMAERIAAACRRNGEPVPDTPARVARCILDSLALAYRRAVRDASRLSGLPVDAVHVVGGGARNELLCRLTAEACGRPVEAGPVEAAALGNALVQARAHGVDLPTLADLRRLVRRSWTVRRYEPGDDVGAWDAAEERVHGRVPAGRSGGSG
jgi:rhamnulokinase